MPFGPSQLVAVSNGLTMRLIGIALASFSSGLGEMTFLQRSTVYGDDDIARLAVGWFSSGTGAAGLVGAALWWELRNLGVKAGLGISSVSSSALVLSLVVVSHTDCSIYLRRYALQILPVCMAASYFLLLPKSSAFRTASKGTLDHRYIPVAAVEEQPDGTSSADSRRRPQNGREEVAYDVDDDEVDDTAPVSPGIMPESMALTKPRLSPSEKLKLARPLFLPFMIPLFVVYFAEYTVNTGVSPTLLYPIPDKQEHPILARIIHKLSDCEQVANLFPISRFNHSNLSSWASVTRRLSAMATGLPDFCILLSLEQRHLSSTPTPQEAGRSTECPAVRRAPGRPLGIDAPDLYAHLWTKLRHLGLLPPHRLGGLVWRTRVRQCVPSSGSHRRERRRRGRFRWTRERPAEREGDPRPARVQDSVRRVRRHSGDRRSELPELLARADPVQM